MPDFTPHSEFAMDTKSLPRIDGSQPAYSEEGAATPRRDRPAAFHAEALDTPPSEGDGRDWGAAIDLVKEACDAIRFSEERAQAAQDYSKQLASHHKDQIKAAEARIAAAERRADVAEKRASDAEAWLTRLHDAIVDGFGNRSA